VKRGEFICEYVGEVLREVEANVRGEQYDEQHCSYLFDLDYTEDATFWYDGGACAQRTTPIR